MKNLEFKITIILKLINEHNIKHIQTSTHAHTIERFLKTFKHSLYIILDALTQDKREWVKHVKHIVDKYNNTVHSTIEIKHVDVVKQKQSFVGKLAFMEFSQKGLNI